ncbi:hypothetical protein D3C77_768280 [compost metagenome]
MPKEPTIIPPSRVEPRISKISGIFTELNNRLTWTGSTLITAKRAVIRANTRARIRDH